LKLREESQGDRQMETKKSKNSYLTDADRNTLLLFPSRSRKLIIRLQGLFHWAMQN